MRRGNDISDTIIEIVKIVSITIMGLIVIGILLSLLR
jgi:hypothetical protein